MADIREIVTQDRGWLKKIQAFLPGYKKYRKCEDLRAADNLIRLQIGQRLRAAEQHLFEVREDLARKMDMENLNVIGELINKEHSLTEKIIHAEQGYSPWISGDVRIEEEELNKLYDFDLSLMENAQLIADLSKKMSDDIVGDGMDIRSAIRKLSEHINSLDRTFSSRIEVVTRIAQK
ncbi:MAG: hypothetical protein QCI82_02875 [Candidatus Thermoplasmatota archaeon]|nr:hypothetical protein [Candidatus Thermoplasmatota archaeon]